MHSSQAECISVSTLTVSVSHSRKQIIFYSKLDLVHVIIIFVNTVQLSLTSRLTPTKNTHRTFFCTHRSPSTGVSSFRFTLERSSSIIHHYERWAFPIFRSILVHNEHIVYSCVHHMPACLILGSSCGSI